MEILYSDKQIAVCIKPVGLDSEQEVPAELIRQLGGECFPIHRLDKNVGGVMVYARTKAAAAALSLQQGLGGIAGVGAVVVDAQVDFWIFVIFIAQKFCIGYVHCNHSFRGKLWELYPVCDVTHTF